MVRKCFQGCTRRVACKTFAGLALETNGDPQDSGACVACMRCVHQDGTPPVGQGLKIMAVIMSGRAYGDMTCLRPGRAFGLYQCALGSCAPGYVVAVVAFCWGPSFWLWDHGCCLRMQSLLGPRFPLMSGFWVWSSGSRSQGTQAAPHCIPAV